MFETSARSKPRIELGTMSIAGPPRAGMKQSVVIRGSVDPVRPGHFVFWKTHFPALSMLRNSESGNIVKQKKRNREGHCVFSS